MDSRLTIEECKRSWAEGLAQFTPRDYLTLYVNIPFCREHCSFCLYYRNSYTGSSDGDVVLDQLESEAESYSDTFRRCTFRALYVGGGTPSLLTAKQIERLQRILVSNFDISFTDDSFRCFEAHPAYLTESKLSPLLSKGFFNRLSFGIQSFDEAVIAKTGRFYVGGDKLRGVIECARGIASGRKLNINVDLMTGLEGDSTAALCKSFDLLAKMKVPRIAVYCNRNKDVAEGELFRAHALSVIAALATHVAQAHNVYNLLNHSIDKYNEAFAWGIRDEIDSRVFEYFYNSSPIDYNNNLGLGFGSSSHIIPSGRIYWKARDGYTILDGSDKFKKVILNRSRPESRINSFNF